MLRYVLNLFLIFICTYAIADIQHNHPIKITESPVVEHHQCKDLGYYLYYCKPFSCVMPVKQKDFDLKGEVLVEVWNKEEKCHYKRTIKLKAANKPPYQGHYECALSKEGIMELYKEFLELEKSKDMGYYMRSSKNGILRKECRFYR